MTMGKNHARPRVTAIPAVARRGPAARGLLVGACRRGLAVPAGAGGACDSVAAADPAVPKTGKAGNGGPREPLRLLPGDMARAGAPIRKAALRKAQCEAECGFDPFGWLAGCSARSDDDDRPGDAPETVPNRQRSIPPPPLATSKSRTGDSGAAGPSGRPRNGSKRRPVTIRAPTICAPARSWRASGSRPSSTADGVYREASHVRVVLEPAGWRLR